MNSRLELTRVEKSSRATRTLPCAAETLPSTGLTSLEMFGQQILITDLQKRMIESLQLRGMSKRTEEAYVRAARQLAHHYHKSPDLITEEELRQYFLYIKSVKNWSPKVKSRSKV